MSGDKKDRGGVVGNRRRRGQDADRDKNEVSRERQGALLKLRDKDGGATSGSLSQVKDKEDGRMGRDTNTLSYAYHKGQRNHILPFLIIRTRMVGEQSEPPALNFP